MRSWRGQLRFFGLATLFTAAVVYGCAAPESFHLTDAETSGSGGAGDGTGGVGSGGSGSGGSATGTGGHGSGGATGSGGVSGTGGRGSGGTTGRPGTGGPGATGRGGGGGRVSGTFGSGGSAAAGRSGTAGRTGAAGRSGSGGAGGRGGRSGAFGQDGGNCVMDIQANGYAYGTAPACSACTDNGTSLEKKCDAVIDCLAPVWPCTGNCVTDCDNASGASGPVMACVSALMTAACGM